MRLTTATTNTNVTYSSDHSGSSPLDIPPRDELEALFDVGSDADMEDGEEEDEGTSSSTRVDPSVGSRRPREDNSDASSSKRSRSGSDRLLLGDEATGELTFLRVRAVGHATS
ncbi:unnamed protein product [Phytophthora fragariaefolia]|uniref:Unnamed protein product n=1 Tax=Phytophthora fragariaefolia TaxID=1490495 RepID=A0A9W6X4M0_9STRA|nr:unnamed protein product [Phytophthora fragariaefolia]